MRMNTRVIHNSNFFVVVIIGIEIIALDSVARY